MTEKTAREATRRRACGAFDGENHDEDRVTTAALMRAHDITDGLHTAQKRCIETNTVTRTVNVYGMR